MKSTALFVMAAAAAITSSRATAQGQSVTNIQDGVVYVRLVDAQGTLKQHGSGFLLGGGGYIMTARHVLEQYNQAQDKITVSLKNKSAPPIEARRFECETGEVDLCLLYIHSSHVANAGIKDYFSFTCRDPEQNEPLIVAGYPLGQFSPMTVVPGVISSTELGEGLRYYMTAPVLPGMSGGPVFGKTGAVIGVVFGVAEGLPLSTFTPLAHSPELLQKAKAACPSSEDAQVASAPPATASSPADAGHQSQANAASANMQPLNTSASNQNELQRVYLQVPNIDKKRMVEDKVVDDLRAANIPVATKAEVVASSPSRGEIRYSGDADLANAEKVKGVLESKGPERFTLKKIKGSSGIVEVWYPKV